MPTKQPIAPGIGEIYQSFGNEVVKARTNPSYYREYLKVAKASILILKALWRMIVGGNQHGTCGSSYTEIQDILRVVGDNLQ